MRTLTNILILLFVLAVAFLIQRGHDVAVAKCAERSSVETCLATLN